MKIIFLNKYQNKISRGAETFVYELSKRLSENHEVTVLSSINYVNLFKKDFDIIVPTNGRFQVIATRLISWLKGAKMIVSGQSGIGWDDKVNLLSFPDCFCALSTKQATWAKKFNPFIKVIKIPNGVDLERFTKDGKGLDTKLVKPIILAVGAFTIQKQMDLAIKAVSRFKSASLLLVGSGGNQKEYLEKMGRTMLGDRFSMMSVPFEEMPKVYRTADLFTLPSSASESFGNVIVEAMAANLPVVARNDDVRREIIGGAGVLVDPENIEKYSEALGGALNKKWGNAPRQQAEKFGWDGIAQKYEEVIKSITK